MLLGAVPRHQSCTAGNAAESAPDLDPIYDHVTQRSDGLQAYTELASGLKKHLAFGQWRSPLRVTALKYHSSSREVPSGVKHRRLPENVSQHIVEPVHTGVDQSGDQSGKPRRSTTKTACLPVERVAPRAGPFAGGTESAAPAGEVPRRKVFAV